MRRLSFAILLLAVFSPVFSQTTAKQTSAVKIARLKYSGGGDWYNDPRGEVNLLKFIAANAPIDVEPVYEFVEATDEKFFSYPFVFLTGHGNISFSEAEASRIRIYLENGGFIYADDDYGMDKAFRRELKKIFPGQTLVELPFSYGLYDCFYDFSNGPPKTHEHDKKNPQGFGIFLEGRLVLYYTYESNPSDAWNDPEVHGDPPAKREEAFRFGTNVLVWALTQ